MGNRIIAIIPARGGSKRIHNKNLYPIPQAQIQAANGSLSQNAGY